MNKKLNTFIAFCLGLLIPGWGQILLQQYRLGFIFIGIWYAVVLVICWSRWVTLASGFFSLLLTLGLIPIAACICIWVTNLNQSSRISTNLPSLVLFPALFLSITSTLYYYRETVLGFGIYHIPTPSMQPALHQGDFIIVDTWAYHETEADKNDIVLFHKTPQDLNALIKRVQEKSINPINQQTRYFLIGDNTQASSDSRHFGWIDHSLLKGKARFTFLNRSQDGIALNHNAL